MESVIKVEGQGHFADPKPSTSVNESLTKPTWTLPPLYLHPNWVTEAVTQSATDGDKIHTCSPLIRPSNCLAQRLRSTQKPLTQVKGHSNSPRGSMKTYVLPSLYNSHMLCISYFQSQSEYRQVQNKVRERKQRILTKKKKIKGV